MRSTPARIVIARWSFGEDPVSLAASLLADQADLDRTLRSAALNVNETLVWDRVGSTTAHDDGVLSPRVVAVSIRRSPEGVIIVKRIVNGRGYGVFISE